MMKKLSALLVAVFFTASANAQPLFGKEYRDYCESVNVTTARLPSPAVEVIKFHKIAGNTALCEVSQTTGGVVYLQTKVTADTNSIIAFLGPITEVSGASFSDTLVVPDTLKSYVKANAFADSLGTMPVDSTPWVLMTYDPIISSYTITPITGGYISEVKINTGNTRCTISKQVALYPDTTFQFPFTYRNDTVFGVGTTLVLRDSVKNLSSPQVALGFCDKLEIKQLLPWNTFIVDTVDCGSTLVQGATPTASWYGSCTPASTTIDLVALVDAFGQAGVLKIYARVQGTTTVIDSIVINTLAVTGAQQHNLNFQNLLTQTTYEFFGTITTSFGTANFPLVVCTTLPPASTLTNTITNVTVGTDVKIQFAYTNVSGHTCNLTVGYGDLTLSSINSPAIYAGLANNGTLTATFSLPNTTGWYAAAVYGYDEQTIQFSVQDTMHFYVGSLTGIVEAYKSGDVVPIIKICNILGDEIIEKRNVTFTPALLLNETALADGVYLIRFCDKYGTIRQTRKEVSRGF